jgi:hypothetical protein
MATNRKRRTRAAKRLEPWEWAFLTGDESLLRPGTRDAARLATMRRDPDSWFMYGDRTGRELLAEYPQYRRQTDGNE